LSGQFDAAIIFKYRRYCNTKNGIPPSAKAEGGMPKTL
jgi:hypothetical protein